MKILPVAAALLSVWSLSAGAANPFLDVPNGGAVWAKFSGTEWGDEIGADEVPLSATVVTQRIAKMSWGAVYEVRFEQIRSRTTPPREIAPEYFVVTDDRIVLLNEENNVEAAQRLEKLDAAPPFEEDAVYAISQGTVKHSEGPRDTTVKVKGDTCTYSSSHSSGHFKRVVWNAGAALSSTRSGGARALMGFG